MGVVGLNRGVEMHYLILIDKKSILPEALPGFFVIGDKDNLHRMISEKYIYRELLK